MSMEEVVSALEQVQTGKNVMEATDFLKSLTTQRGFTSAVLELLISEGLSPEVQQGAALLLKNAVVSNWVASEDNHGEEIPDSDKHTIKENIVSVMTASSEAVQKQLSDIVAHISKTDFPAQWDTLLQELLEKCDPGNLLVLLGVLETANSVFSRYQDLFEEDELLLEIKHVCKQWREPFNQIVEGLVEMLEKGSGGDKENYTLIVRCLKLCMNIWYSLNWHDLAFDLHVDQYLGFFSTLLTFDGTDVLGEDRHEREGPVELLKVSIVEALILMYEKYAEDWEDKLEPFVSSVWEVLSQCSPDPKFDNLVSQCVRFLATVAKSTHHTLFADHNTMKMICEQAIIPNLKLTENDELLFEDSPIEYIQKDLEESDSGTRRRNAFEFVQALCIYFSDEITRIYSEYLDSLLQEYASNPVQNYACKDVAIFLVTALTVKKSTMLQGASEVNEMVPLIEWMQEHILPELTVENINSNPIIKADCIRFISTFRRQIPQNMYPDILSILLRLLSAESVVVHTYAACTIDRMMNVRDQGERRLNKNMLLKDLEALLSGLFAIAYSGECTENEYAMRCILRVVICVGADVAQYAETIVTTLSGIMADIHKNPRVPGFNHYLFETITALIRLMPNAVESFEQSLFPYFQDALANNVREFFPYIFQVMSLLLESRQTGGGTEFYDAMFEPLLEVELYESYSNVPGLAGLLESFIHKLPNVALAENTLMNLLGVWQLLNADPRNDQYAFRLLQAFIKYHPPTIFSDQIWVQIMDILFTRLKNKPTLPYKKRLVVFFSLFAFLHGPDDLLAKMDALDAGIFANSSPAWLPSIVQIEDEDDKKIVILGLEKFLCESEWVQSSDNLEFWGNLLDVALMFAIQDHAPSQEDEADGGVNEVLDYEPGHATLANAIKSDFDAAPDIEDAGAFLAKSLASLIHAKGEYLGAAIEHFVDPSRQAALKEVMGN